MSTTFVRALRSPNTHGAVAFSVIEPQQSWSMWSYRAAMNWR